MERLKIRSKPINLHKGFKTPDFKSSTVLVRSRWDYVEMWLRRRRLNDAIFYWSQAKSFYEASTLLPNTSSPLTLYYSFLNATKALLTVKNVNFVERHGVAGNRQPGNTNLENEQVTFHKAGILNALSGYLEDPHIGARHNHSFKDLLYNLPFIHRAFKLTFPTGYPEIYIPVEDAGFVIERPNRDIRFHFKLMGNYATGHTVNKIASLGFAKNENLSSDKEFCMQSNETIVWPSQANQQVANLNRLTDFHKNLRRQFQYIFGTKTLWYFKRTNVAHVVDKSQLTIMFACMHRLSELARYEPITLAGHFRLSQNWLLNEFIQGATYEFIDHISCEITNQKFMEPAIRK